MPVTDEELRRGLALALGRRVDRVRRRAHPYSSTHPVEELDVTVAGGERRRFMLKDLAATCCGELGDRAALLDPRREIEAYNLLGARGAGAPACMASAADPRPDRAWLVLEAVAGVPLWQHGDREPWLAAARWLARLHGGGVPADPRPFVRCDAAHLRRWLPLAVAATAPGALDAVGAVWEHTVTRLAAWPATFVHGEFYPSNILVADGDALQVRPVDWEMAGVGPGVLDLAALVAGGWSAQDRERMVRAYHAELPAHDRPTWPELADALTHARLHQAVQWLGWSPRWTPPADHAHDWLAEAQALAEELAP